MEEVLQSIERSEHRPAPDRPLVLLRLLLPLLNKVGIRATGDMMKSGVLAEDLLPDSLSDPPPLCIRIVLWASRTLSSRRPSYACQEDSKYVGYRSGLGWYRDSGVIFDPWVIEELCGGRPLGGILLEAT